MSDGFDITPEELGIDDEQQCEIERLQAENERLREAALEAYDE
jgi:hypothetical protein